MKPSEEFELFKKEFERYQKLFGLMGYKVYFWHDPLENSDVIANIFVDQGEMVASVKLNSKLSRDAQKYKDIKKAARHEAIHLLTGRLERYAKSRAVSGDDIYEATEELVHRLECLIPDSPEEDKK
jgi:hypothetical protein